MRKTLYSCIVLLIGFSACHGYTKPGAGIYFFVSAANDNPRLASSHLDFGNFLELRPDGSFSQDFGKFNYGSWMIKESRLYLTTQHHRTYIYLLVDSLKPGELDLALDSGWTALFQAHSMPSDNPKKDPFSTFNNHWRIPATHKESDAELRARLVNHFQFWETYFTWEKDRDSGAINVTGIPTPLKIYGNGFGLKHYSDLTPEWRSFFYDSVDCHRTDTMIKHTFRRHEFVWPKTDDDLKKLISATQQLQEWFK